MSSDSDREKSAVERADQFGETSWTSISAARQASSAISRQALEELCQTYWYPLYAYIRRCGHGPEDAQDLTQAFFCEFLEKNLLSQVDRQKGKFRAYLLACLNLFLSNHRKYLHAQKRGGGQATLSFDRMGDEERYRCEPLSDDPPEHVFDRQWARELLEQARARLRNDYATAGKGRVFDQLLPYLSRETGAEYYRAEAAALSMTPAAVAVAVHRLRHRFGEIIHEELSRTVASERDIADEYSYLRALLSQSSDTRFMAR